MKYRLTVNFYDHGELELFFDDLDTAMIIMKHFVDGVGLRPVRLFDGDEQLEYADGTTRSI